MHELLLRIVARVDLREGSKLGVGANTKSTVVAVHLTSPVAPSRPSYTFSAESDAFHSVLMSSRFTKKSLVSVSGRWVNAPCRDCLRLAFRARMPPMRTDISGGVRVNRLARYTSKCSAGIFSPARR